MNTIGVSFSRVELMVKCGGEFRPTINPLPTTTGDPDHRLEITELGIQDVGTASEKWSILIGPTNTRRQSPLGLALYADPDRTDADEDYACLIDAEGKEMSDTWTMSMRLWAPPEGWEHEGNQYVFEMMAIEQGAYMRLFLQNFGYARNKLLRLEMYDPYKGYEPYLESTMFRSHTPVELTFRFFREHNYHMIQVSLNGENRFMRPLGLVSGENAISWVMRQLTFKLQGEDPATPSGYGVNSVSFWNRTLTDSEIIWLAGR